MAGRRRQADRREEAERSIVEAAINLVATQGYDGFTLSQIGEAAGYSRGLPTHYFGRKDALLSAAAAEIIGGFEERLKAIGSTRRGLDRIIEIIDVYMDSLDHDATRVRALNVILGAALTHPDLAQDARRLNKEGRRLVRDEIEIGKGLGNIRADADADLQAQAIASFLRGCIGYKLIDAEMDQKAVAAEFVTWLRRALAP